MKKSRFIHNKKAMAVLSLSAIAFLVAVMLFYSRSVNLKPGPDSEFLGQTETDIYKTYMNGEAELLYLDIAAEHSVDAVRKQDKFMAGESHNLLERIPDLQTLFKNHKEDFLKAFAEDFKKYLNEFNRTFPGSELKIEDYTFTLDSRGITGVTEKQITITTKYHDYTFKPNFRVFIDTGLAEEIAYNPEEGSVETTEGTPAEEMPVKEIPPEVLQEEPKSEELAVDIQCESNEGAGGKCREGTCNADEKPFNERNDCAYFYDTPRVCCVKKTADEPVTLGIE